MGILRKFQEETELWRETRLLRFGTKGLLVAARVPVAAVNQSPHSGLGTARLHPLTAPQPDTRWGCQ